MSKASCISWNRPEPWEKLRMFCGGKEPADVCEAVKESWCSAETHHISVLPVFVLILPVHHTCIITLSLFPFFVKHNS